MDEPVRIERVFKNSPEKRAKMRAAMAARMKTDRSKAIARQANRRLKFKLKLECLRRYGGSPPRCACCGETEIGFLTLDHADNDGQAHRRKERNASSDLYRWLRSRGFPSEPKIVVLCFNCNMGRAINGGTCPHKVPMTLDSFGRAKRYTTRSMFDAVPNDQIP